VDMWLNFSADQSLVAFSYLKNYLTVLEKTYYDYDLQWSFEGWT
jgi:hypothetical protein